MGAITNASLLARDAAFQDRVVAATVGLARGVLAAGETNVYRAAYARAIIQNPMTFADAFVWIIATDPEVSSRGATSESVDDDLLLIRVKLTWGFMAAPPTAGPA